MVIDAKNERVPGWYAGYGAVPLLDARNNRDGAQESRKILI
jgi:hypothetical protein